MEVRTRDPGGSVDRIYGTIAKAASKNKTRCGVYLSVVNLWITVNKINNAREQYKTLAGKVLIE